MNSQIIPKANMRILKVMKMKKMMNLRDKLKVLIPQMRKIKIR